MRFSQPIMLCSNFFSNIPIMLSDFPIMLHDFNYYAQILNEKWTTKYIYKCWSITDGGLTSIVF